MEVHVKPYIPPPEMVELRIVLSREQYVNLLDEIGTMASYSKPIGSYPIMLSVWQMLQEIER